MVNSLKTAMNERLKFLENKILDIEDKLTSYKNNTKYYKAELIEIKEQIKEIHNLGF